MVNDMTLEIKNVGPIADAKIDIAKINIVGGVNGTGKSMSSKLLYCFLKANSENNAYLVFKMIENKLEELSELLNKYYSFLTRTFYEGISKLMDKYPDLSTNDLYKLSDEDPECAPKELSKLLIEYSDLKASDLDIKFDSYRGSLFYLFDSFNILDTYNNFKNQYFSDYFQDLIDYSNSQISVLENKIDDLSKKTEEYKNTHYITEDNIYTEHKEYASMSSDIDYCVLKLLDAELYKKIESKFKEMDDFIEGLKTDSEEVFKQSMMDLLFSEFGIGQVNAFDYAKLYGPGFNFNINFKNYDIVSKGSFDIINVFYLSSYTFFDIGSKNLFYTDDLKNNISHKGQGRKINFADGSFKEEPINLDVDNSFDEKIDKLEKIVTEIIGGHISSLGSFKTSDYSCSITNTSSGIKQIGIIQALLENHALTKGSVLIMDEPEVNLHPGWQIKLAEILVLLAKKLDVIIYINSHSPMFIEAVDTYSEIYSMEHDVNYYLTHKSDNSRYDIIKIDNHDLGIIYDNLGNPYDILDKAKLQKPRI